MTDLDTVIARWQGAAGTTVTYAAPEEIIENAKRRYVAGQITIEAFEARVALAFGLGSAA